MSKLVLFLADGTTLDVPLKRERMTIGRRADNDICLPNLAVSGEHAAVVTILADSFLEDLGSTNGTLVNGTPIAKHLLRDNDQIDVGRHILVFCTDEDAVLAPKTVRSSVRSAAGDLGDKVEAAKPFVKTRNEKAGGGSAMRRERVAENAAATEGWTGVRAGSDASQRRSQGAPRADPRGFSEDLVRTGGWPCCRPHQGRDNDRASRGPGGAFEAHGRHVRVEPCRGRQAPLGQWRRSVRQRSRSCSRRRHRACWCPAGICRSAAGGRFAVNLGQA